MSKFIVILKDRKNGELSKNLLRMHVDHLRKLSIDKKLILCGPFKTSDNAIQILEAESLVKLDPFIKHQYYTSYAIDELVEANESNNFLS